jgi:hypothetical protein
VSDYKRPAPDYADSLRKLGITMRVHVSEYGTAWCRQTLIRRPLRKPLAELMFDFVRAVGEGGPGRPFHMPPYIVKRTRRYLVIHQPGGLDV